MVRHTSRRSFFTGLASLIAAPAIVRAGSLMPVKAPRVVFTLADYDRIMKPILDKMAQQIADNIMNGGAVLVNSELGLLSFIAPQDLYVQA